MPRPGGNPNLKGNKNSGRKSFRFEWNKAQTTYKAWKKVDEEVENNLNVATQIVLKDMGKDDKSTGNITLIVENYGDRDKDTIQLRTTGIPA